MSTIHTYLEHAEILLDQTETQSLVVVLEAYLKDRPINARGWNLTDDLARDLLNTLAH